MEKNFKTSPTKQNLVDFFYGFFSKFTPHRRIIGEAKRRLNDRFNEHRRSVGKTNIKSKPTTVAEHFLSHPNHCHTDMQLIPLELIHSSRDSIRKARESFLNSGAPAARGPPSGAPYSSRKEKETHELKFSWLSWLAVLLVGAYARRRRRRRRPEEFGHAPNCIMVEVINQSGACIFLQVDLEGIVAQGMKRFSLRVFSVSTSLVIQLLK